MGCLTTTELYNTRQFKIEITISINTDLPNVTVSPFDIIGSLDHMIAISHMIFLNGGFNQTL